MSGRRRLQCQAGAAEAQGLLSEFQRERVVGRALLSKNGLTSFRSARF
jgi:hypothetical protein